MAIEVGADLWHMHSVEWATQSFKPEEMPAAFWLQPKADSWTNVNKYGKRFRDESFSFAHSKRRPDIFNYSENIKGDADFPNSNWFLVFDEKVRQAGPIVLTERWKGAPRFITYNDSREIYTWSNDNRPEIERGWVKTADSIGGLARIIGVDPPELQRTISNYNQYCVQRLDTEYKRIPDTLVPVDTPPYYAMECVMGIINTQGGPKRNSKSQVVGALGGNPIPRLYAGGEFGSIWNILYPGGCNLSECIVSGLISSRNAMSEARWE
jgi:succinate dehydrogenase/fumarate reductase flavoprotein subunit